MEDKSYQSKGGAPLPHDLQRKRYRIKIIALCMALLLSGMLIGAGGMFFYGRKLVLQNIRRGADPARITMRLSEKLDLSVEQKQKVEEILNRHMPRIREIRKSKYVQVRQEINTMREDISAILDQRQAGIWDEETNRIMPFRRYNHHRHRGQ